MKKVVFITIGILTTLPIWAQEASKIKISGYLEAYYGYDFSKPAMHNRPGFVYSHNRHNEVTLNLGFIKATYEERNIRANMAFMAGTYPNVNLATEPGVLKNVFEANAGIKLSKKENIWLDAGIFASHIGFESAISKDCWALTRNIASENTPYYESGTRLSYSSADNRLTAVLLFLNGWQRIARPDGNNKPAGGLQVLYKPNDKITFNYSNYIGTEGVDAVFLKRFYHNFYVITRLNEKFGLTAGFDYATQQKAKGRAAKSQILSPVLITQVKLASRWAITTRIEYYKDKDGVFISTATANGFETIGYSLNVDYMPVSNAVIRLEGKCYNSKDNIFTNGINLVNNNKAITASIAISF
ncbi:MAG: porin [Bacteroidota bacterium]